MKTLFTVAFNVSNTTSKFSMAVLFYVLTYKPCTVRSVCVLRSTTEFYIPGSYDSLVIAIKSKATTNVRAVTFCFTYHKNITNKKINIFYACSIPIISRC